MNKEPIKLLKLGIDPTTSELHIGHAVPLIYASKLQERGYKLCLVLGTMTAQLGDPTGRNKLRPQLSKEEVLNSAEKLLEKIKLLVDTSPEKFEVYYNDVWLNKLTPSDLIQRLAYVTVAQMLERRDFKTRYTSQTPISLSEFLYPILQAEDSVFLYSLHKASGRDVSLMELGGTDQMFNINMGSHIMESLGLPSQDTAYVDLIVGTDGVNKMSKSLGNHVPIQGDAYDSLIKLMQVNDGVMHKYIHLFYLKKVVEATPRETKIKQVRSILIEVCKLSVEEVDKAFERYNSVSSKNYSIEQLGGDFLVTAEFDTSFAHFMKRVEICSSISEANRFISAPNTVKLNGKNLSEVVQPGEYMLSVGKKRAFKVRVVKALLRSKKPTQGEL